MAIDRSTIWPYDEHGEPGDVLLLALREPDGRRGGGARSASSTAAQALLFPSGTGAATALVLALLQPGDTIALAEGCYFGTGVTFQALERWGLRYVEFDQTGAAARRRAARLARGAVEPVPDDARPRSRGRAPRAASSSTRPSRRPCTCGRSSTAPTSCCTARRSTSAGHDDALARRRRLQGRGDGDELRTFRTRTGIVAAPDPAWLLLRGLKTLEVRVAAADRDRPARLAERLRGAPEGRDRPLSRLRRAPLLRRRRRRRRPARRDLDAADRERDLARRRRRA